MYDNILFSISTVKIAFIVIFLSLLFFKDIIYFIAGVFLSFLFVSPDISSFYQLKKDHEYITDNYLSFSSKNNLKLNRVIADYKYTLENTRAYQVKPLYIRKYSPLYYDGDNYLFVKTLINECFSKKELVLTYDNFRYYPALKSPIQHEINYIISKDNYKPKKSICEERAVKRLI